MYILKVFLYDGPGLPIGSWVKLLLQLFRPLPSLSRQIWSPPSYATAHTCHGLSTGTMETRHLSARTKLKCNSHFTINVIIMRHSVMFLQKLLLFFYFLCSFANQSLFFYLKKKVLVFHFFIFIFYLHIFFLHLCLSLELQKDS